jgi:hypothetical protein
MQQIKSLSITLFVFVLLFGAINTTYAQVDTIRLNGHVSARLVLAVPGYNIRDVYEPANDAGATLSESSINIRAVRDFKKRYKNAIDETWLPATKGFAVRFLDNGVSTTVRYTAAGNWLHTMKRYHEPNLPREIRALVKPVYYDYSIVVIYELSDYSLKEPVYYIHLKENLKYKIVQVSNEGMEEIQSFWLQKK